MWNLTAHEGAKAMVVKEKALEALVMQLRESRDHDVWQKCAGCLMVLAANSDKVKALAGQEGAIPELSNIVRKSGPNKAVLKAALGALAVLSSDERNLTKLRAEVGPCRHARLRRRPRHLPSPNLFPCFGRASSLIGT